MGRRDTAGFVHCTRVEVGSLVGVSFHRPCVAIGFMTTALVVHGDSERFVETSGKTEFLCDACLCTTNTLFMPADCTQWLGQTSKGLLCCIDAADASCIMRNHPQFEQLVSGEKEGVCCICNTGSMAFVKPLCLSSEMPCLKTVGMGCCFSSRMSIPSDLDAPCQCAACGAKCCGLFPFERKLACFERTSPGMHSL